MLNRRNVAALKTTKKMITEYDIQKMRHSYMRQKNYAALEGFDACLKLFSEDEDEGGSEPKKPSFWQRHKGKILGGALALAAAGGAAGMSYANKIGRFEGRASDILAELRDPKINTLWELANGPLKKAQALVAEMVANQDKVSNLAKSTITRALNQAKKMVSELAWANGAESVNVNEIEHYNNVIGKMRDDVDAIKVNAVVSGVEGAKDLARRGKAQFDQWRNK